MLLLQAMAEQLLAAIKLAAANKELQHPSSIFALPLNFLLMSLPIFSAGIKVLDLQ
jgi:hypothetical protein